MKVTGIIAEYNPFHNGHKYQIDKVKEITGADYIIVVMSGNFTQRGTPALLDKYKRAQMALLGGADFVIELPVCYATASAEYFANGAIALLTSLGCVDSICFGSECGNIDELTRIAKAILNETSEYRKLLKSYLKNGYTYPVARKTALQNTMKDFASIENILTYPNNILGIEYIKAIIKQKSKIIPFTNKRIGSDYHSYKLSTYSFSSAISIRQSLLANDNLDLVKSQIPQISFPVMEQNYQRNYPIFTNDFSILLKYKLLQQTPKEFTEYLDVTKEISDRIVNHIFAFETFDQFCNLLKTKEVTYARISRCLSHILLNITKSDMLIYQKNHYIFYARILALNTNASELTKMMKQTTKIPLISKLSDSSSYLYPIGQKQLSQDVFASHIYESLISYKFKTPMQDEYRHQIIKSEQ